MFQFVVQNVITVQFWRQQLRDVHVLNQPLVEFKNHPLPLARIKKIMKSDEDVRMISSEAPVLFAKACELFILELTHRAWAYSEANKRRTLQHNDLVHAICNHENEVFEFLVRFANPHKQATCVWKISRSVLGTCIAVQCHSSVRRARQNSPAHDIFDICVLQTDNIPPEAVQAASDGTAIIPPAMYATMAAATGSAPGSAPQAPGVSPFIPGLTSQAGTAQPSHYPNGGATLPLQATSDAAAQPQPGAQAQVIPPTQAPGQVWAWPIA